MKVAKFTPGDDATYPMTYFVAGQAIRLAPGDVYETDDAGVIEEMKAHGGLKAYREPKGEKKAAKDD